MHETSWAMGLDGKIAAAVWDRSWRVWAFESFRLEGDGLTT